MTNAELARVVACLNTATTAALQNLVEGMWNPAFCSAAASESMLATRLMERMAPAIAALTQVCETGHPAQALLLDIAEGHRDERS